MSKNVLVSVQISAIMGNGKGPKIEDTDFILLHITIFLMRKKNLGGNITLLK